MIIIDSLNVRYIKYMALKVKLERNCCSSNSKIIHFPAYSIPRSGTNLAIYLVRFHSLSRRTIANAQCTHSPQHPHLNQSINQSVNQSIGRSTNQSINQSTNRSVHQSISQPIYQSTNQSVNRTRRTKRPLSLYLPGLDQPDG